MNPIQYVYRAYGITFGHFGFKHYLFRCTLYKRFFLILIVLHSFFCEKGAGQSLPAKGIKNQFSSSSVLSAGKWYKLSTSQTGIYRIGYSDLKAMGIDPSQVDPRNIRIYGNGGGMLPEKNADDRYDDLNENAIKVTGESDGSFDTGDYILFYATSPVTWKYNSLSGLFEHSTNQYSDSLYYFLTTGLGRGKRLNTMQVVQEPANTVVTSFDKYDYVEKDELNLIRSGKDWFGDQFDIVSSRDYKFSLPSLLQGSSVRIRFRVASRSTSLSSFTLSSTGSSQNYPLLPVSRNVDDAYATAIVNSFIVPASSESLLLNLKYNKPDAVSLGWLDFIEVNARCKLQFNNGQFAFRDALSVGTGRIAEYHLGNAPAGVTVWDVTQPLNPRAVNFSAQSGEAVFRVNNDTLREFIAFDGSQFYTPKFLKVVPNQNLHALQGCDMVIVSPPVFISQAQRLASFHQAHDGISTVIVTPESVYNEFSSGAPDATAIRDFMRMLSARTSKPKYLLLFGDGSYDNKNRLTSNTAFILTYQSAESLQPTLSYNSDDYFGCLASDQGGGDNDIVSIGVGRFPVKTVDEAKTAVDKLIHYSEDTTGIHSSWFKKITFVADDEDYNIHMEQADNMAEYVSGLNPEFDQEKIYLDAYPQYSTPTGAQYPDVNKAITKSVTDGVLILNYTGHGGELGLAKEQVVDIPGIKSWHNYSALPLFITGTCEFSRFDDPALTSAGEWIFLNPDGGGIALFSTTRPTYGNPNFYLNKSLLKYALSDINGVQPRLGDILRLSKAENGHDVNGKKFILLGDPALSLKIPDYRVNTISINGRVVGPVPDTLKAFELYTVKGRISGSDGRIAGNFNGTLIPVVYDKEDQVNTLANDGGSVFNFMVRKNIIFKGNIEVKNGLFSFTFPVPKDIQYQFGKGFISYYAYSGTENASGYDDNVIVGGIENKVTTDISGPSIRLFLNDTTFKYGGVTGPNPTLLAFVSDPSGINSVGSGIGHDIIAVLDDHYDSPFVLNEYYTAAANSYTEGRIAFLLNNISPGKHMLKLRVWDIYNNSSESQVEFIVQGPGKALISEVLNYPNPFRDFTRFVFKHNFQDIPIDIQIDIFTTDGKMVASLIKKNDVSYSSQNTPVEWDGRSSNGNRVSPGIYFYRITVIPSTGTPGIGSGKLILSP